jgi:hypothetical protein
MTQKQVSNLARMQIGKLSEASIRLALEKKKVSPAFLRRVLMESRSEKVLGVLISHFVEKAKRDFWVKKFLGQMVLEDFNKNEVLRRKLLEEFMFYAKNKNMFFFKELLRGIKDSAIENKRLVYYGLHNLAREGESKTINALINGTREADKDIKRWSVEGLKSLSRRGNKNAKKVLEELGL